MEKVQERSLIELLRYYKKGNTEEQKNCLEDIILIMKPAIRKCANKVPVDDRDDVEQELSIAIIEAIPKLDVVENEGQCINYLYTAIQYRFCKWCREWKKRNQEIEGEIQQMILQEKVSVNEYENINFGVDLFGILQCSSELQKKIMLCILTAEASDIEIAAELNISRQYVNRCKKEIFKKLPDYVRR